MVTAALLFLAAAVPLDGVDAKLEEIADGLVFAAAAAMHTGPSYAKAKDADAAATKTAFAPMCAAKLEEIADQWKATRHPELTLGHSLGTHMQVQCTHGLPMDEASCDKLATQLQVTLDAGKPWAVPAPANDTNSSNATASLMAVRRVLPDEQEKTDLVQRTGAENKDPQNATALESVEEWCGVFFDAFFEAIKQSAEEEKGDEAAEEAALVHGTARHGKVATKDAWQPMRALIMKKVRSVQALAAKLGKNASAKVYGKELVAADKKAAEAKAAVYAAAGDADAAKVKEAFLPECVAALEQTAATYLGNGLHGARRTLGLSMATHLQVQCHDGMPIGEEACDDLASQLLQLLDHGNPLVKPTPPPAANGTNATNATEPAAEAKEEAALVVRRVMAGAGRNDTNGSADEGPQVLAHGEEWCGLFFDDFLAGVIAEPDFYAAAKEAEEGAEGEAKEEEAKEFLQRK